MSVSLIAVFIPILLMGGIVGRLFREFAMTLSVAILISLVVSLTTTPMMCALICCAGREQRARPARIARASASSTRCCAFYERTLGWALRHPAARDADPARDDRASTSTSIVIVPKGFFPQQDTGRLIGGIQADQSISFQRCSRS